jgi:hypothetical protein
MGWAMSQITLMMEMSSFCSKMGTTLMETALEMA